jgi:hypothetical protein
MVITFDPDLGHFQTWTAVYPDSIMQFANVPQDPLLFFKDMCAPRPLSPSQLQGILYRVRADRIPYIGQPQAQLDDQNHLPQVEQLDDIDDIDSEPEEKRVEEEIKPARIQKCKYMDLSEMSLMNQGDITPVILRHVQRARESFPWDTYGNTHLYSSLSDIDGAGRGAFTRHQIVAEKFLGWYLDSPFGYPDSDDDDEADTITAYRHNDDEARVYRDAWDSKNSRPTCLVALMNDPLDPLSQPSVGST